MTLFAFPERTCLLRAFSRPWRPACVNSPPSRDRVPAFSVSRRVTPSQHDFGLPSMVIVLMGCLRGDTSLAPARQVWPSFLPVFPGERGSSDVRHHTRRRPGIKERLCGKRTRGRAPVSFPNPCRGGDYWHVTPVFEKNNKRRNPRKPG